MSNLLRWDWTPNRGATQIRVDVEGLELTWYFARPYASWQRGTNENMNGLIREFFPKGTNFGEIGADEIAWVEKLINCRPRKCLNWKAPREVMELTN
ncbi:hypothetical protein GCM10007907_09470 [Chitinimonas prasina]|uniref:IS30 family transposase n=1 Tax=Chitinimonas prasina TaxID=1434937 RepID=A0ABQ5YCJ0_9NEIS|nr:hypothetical protein GCM10007907_09470 [Chitinimonas prasina]